MPSDSPRHGLFSSLTLGRASKSPKQTSETLAHPLLGASTSSLNLASDAAHQNDASASSPSRPVVPPPSGSRVVSGVDLSALPYKPRHRSGHAQGHGHSASTSSALTASSAAVPSSSPTASGVMTTSPVTPTNVSAKPTTSTFTSTTFALPPSSAMLDSNDTQDVIGSANNSSTATSRLQLQSLKAAAQRIGLGNGSMGMSIIDAIFERSLMGMVIGKGKGRDEGDWAEIMNALKSGKVSLTSKFKDFLTRL